MEPRNVVCIGNGPLTIADFESIVDGHGSVSISEATESEMLANEAYLTSVAKNSIVYGINTGFGPLAGHIIDADERTKLQYNLIRSHAMGSGEPIPDRFVRGILVARLSSIVRCRSGISPAATHLLKEYIEHGIYPVIPRHGSVGASGDLVQLAHIARSLIGEGECRVDGCLRSSKSALDEFTITPLAIRGREGLALINGTSAMTGIGACALIDSVHLLRTSLILSAWLYALTDAPSDYVHDHISLARPHKSQHDIATLLKKLQTTKNSFVSQQKIPNEKTVPLSSVQHVYSIRCIPQILGPILESIRTTAQTIETELSSVTDNPVIVTDVGVFHGGNFHGDYVAAKMDELRASITRLCMVTERQLAYLFDRRLNEKLPPFVTMGKPGLDMGLQGAQFTATSITATAQTLSYPARLHSISTNNSNQDIVSMGCDSALLTTDVITMTWRPLAILATALSRATKLLTPSDELIPLLATLNSEISPIAARDDDSLNDKDILSIEEILKSTARSATEIQIL